MATVTAFTAARMLAIENASIVDGEVVVDDLILTRFDTTTINAGSVRGPTGSPGVSSVELEAAFPIGMIIDYIEATPPSASWLAMNGQTIVGGESTYPDLWDKLPASMKSGSNIVMPDTRGRVSVGYNSSDSDFNAIGDIGGSKTHTLITSEMPTHAHSGPSHTHGAGTLSAISNGAHVHNLLDQNGLAWGSGNVVTSGGGPYFGTNVNAGAQGTAASSGAHTHTITGSTAADGTANTGSAGSGSAHNNLQPFIVFLKIIKAL